MESSNAGLRRQVASLNSSLGEEHGMTMDAVAGLERLGDSLASLKTEVGEQQVHWSVLHCRWERGRENSSCPPSSSGCSSSASSCWHRNRMSPGSASHTTSCLTLYLPGTLAG